MVVGQHGSSSSSRLVVFPVNYLNNMRLPILNYLFDNDTSIEYEPLFKKEKEKEKSIDIYIILRKR